MKRYNQSNITIIANGTPVVGLMDGAHCEVQYKGGEVQVTEGTDGPGMNIATKQGGEISFVLQEASPSNADMIALRKMQDLATDIPYTLSIMSGVRALYLLQGAMISVPGELTTGDKKQAGRKYTFIGTNLTEMQL